MRTDGETLDYALSLFFDDDRGAYLSGSAQTIGQQIAMSPQPDPRWAKTVHSNMNCITQDLWNVTTILDRLAWMRMRSVMGDADLSERWRNVVHFDRYAALQLARHFASGYRRLARWDRMW